MALTMKGVTMTNEIGKEMVTCPLCKKERKFTEYLHNNKTSYTTCPGSDCGIVFMIPAFVERMIQFVNHRDEIDANKK